MLGITNYQGNANQSHTEVSPHTLRTAIAKKSANDECWGECGGRGPPRTAGVDVTWGGRHGQRREVPEKNLKKELPRHPEIPLLHIDPKQTKTILLKDTGPLGSSRLYLQRPTWRPPGRPPTDDWVKRRYPNAGKLLSHGKDETEPPGTARPGGEDPMLNQTSRIEGDKCGVIPPPCRPSKHQNKTKTDA